MDINNFEDRIKKLGQLHEQPVELKSLWDAVEEGLEKKKRRPIIIWFLLSVGIASSVGFLSYYNSIASIENQNSIFLEVDPNTKIDLESYSNVVHSNLIDPNNGDKNVVASGQKNKESKTTKDLDNSSPIIVRPLKKELNESVRFNYELSVVKPEKTKYVDQPSERNEILNRESRESTSKSTSSSKQALLGGFSLGNNENSMSSTIKSKSDVTMKMSPIHALSRTIHLSPLPSKSIEHFSAHKLESLPSLSLKKSLVKYQDNDLWRMIIIGGYDHNSINRRRTEGDNLQDVYKIRTESFNTLPSWNIGIELGYSIGHNVVLSSGLKVNKKSGRSTSEIFSSSEVLESDVLIEQIIGPNGVQNVYGEGLVLYETLSLRNRISHQYALSVPITLEYSGTHSLFQPFIGVGVDYSFLIGRSGLVHLSADKEYDTSTDNDDFLSDGMGFAAMGYLGGRLNISNRIWVNSRIRYRKEFYSDFYNHSGISEKYSSFSILLGVEYKF